MKAAYRELAVKYRALLELREQREAREASGAGRFQGADATARRRAFRLIARRFPGALKELEHSDAARLRSLLQRVERASAEGLTPEDAARFAETWRLHLLLRLAGAARRWSRRQAASGRRRTFLSWARRFEAKARVRLPEAWSLRSIAEALGEEEESLFRRALTPPGGRTSAYLERRLRGG